MIQFIQKSNISTEGADLEIQYLNEFVHIAHFGSFSLAAEELNLSQPALSKHIKTLENELQTSLFDRSTRKVALSESGKLLLSYAREITELDNAFRRNLREQNTKGKNHLNIASIPVMAQYNITGAIAQFQNEHPDITLSVREMEGKDILDCLTLKQSELAFYRCRFDDSPLLEYVEFCSDHLVAVLPQDHRFAQEESIPLINLAGENFMFLDKGTMLYSLCEDACRSAGFEPNVTFTGHRPENIVELVSKKMGISLLMTRQAEYLKNPGIVCVNLTPKVTSNIYLIHLKDRRFSAAALRFWEFISQNAGKF